MQKATVKYQIATYSGEIAIFCDENDDNDVIEAKAKRQLIREAGQLPLGVQEFCVVNREDMD